MTHDTVTNFAASLVEMAKAHERVPILEEQVKTLEGENLAYFEMIQRLELRAIDHRNEIDELHAKLRSVEAERDDAGFRHLEAEDKSNAALVELQNIRRMANDVIVAMTGSAKTDMVFMDLAERREWEEHKAERAAKQIVEQEWRLAEASRPFGLDPKGELGKESSPSGESATHPIEPAVGQSVIASTITELPSVSVQEPNSATQEAHSDPIPTVQPTPGLEQKSATSSADAEQPPAAPTEPKTVVEDEGWPFGFSRASHAS